MRKENKAFYKVANDNSFSLRSNNSEVMGPLWITGVWQLLIGISQWGIVLGCMQLFWAPLDHPHPSLRARFFLPPPRGSPYSLSTYSLWRWEKGPRITRPLELQVQDRAANAVKTRPRQPGFYGVGLSPNENSLEGKFIIRKLVQYTYTFRFSPA